MRRPDTQVLLRVRFNPVASRGEPGDAPLEPRRMHSLLYWAMTDSHMAIHIYKYTYRQRGKNMQPYNVFEISHVVVKFVFEQ